MPLGYAKCLQQRPIGVALEALQTTAHGLQRMMEGTSLVFSPSKDPTSINWTGEAPRNHPLGLEITSTLRQIILDWYKLTQCPYENPTAATDRKNHGGSLHNTLCLHDMLTPSCSR